MAERRLNQVNGTTSIHCVGCVSMTEPVSFPNDSGHLCGCAHDPENHAAVQCSPILAASEDRIFWAGARSQREKFGPHRRRQHNRSSLSALPVDRDLSLPVRA